MAVHGLHTGLLEEAGDAIGEAADDVVLPVDRPGEIERRSGNRDAERRGGVCPADRLLELLCNVDQGLGRHAADIETGAARPVLLDDDVVDAELAGSDRADIAARSGTDDEQSAGQFCHETYT